MQQLCLLKNRHRSQLSPNVWQERERHLLSSLIVDTHEFFEFYVLFGLKKNFTAFSNTLKNVFFPNFARHTVIASVPFRHVNAPHA